MAIQTAADIDLPIAGSRLPTAKRERIFSRVRFGGGDRPLCEIAYERNTSAAIRNLKQQLASR